MSVFQTPGVIKAQAHLPNDSITSELADFFKVFGDCSRLRILFVLLDNQLTVNEVAEILSMSQSAVSHQLRTLRQNKLVKVQKEGKTSIYPLDDEHVYRILTQGLEHLSH